MKKTLARGAGRVGEWVLFHKFAVAAAGGFFAAVLLAFVFFVVAVGAFVEYYFSFAFEGEDVGADAVEEPAVVAYDDGASGEVVEAFLEGAEGVDVDVVGGFVEEEDVSFFLEGHCEVEAVALAAGEDCDFLFLVSSGEVEFGEVCAGVDVASAHAEGLDALGDYLVDGFLGKEVVVGLVDVCDFYGLSDFEGTCVGLHLVHYEAEECGLSGAVGADHSYLAVGGQGEVEAGEEGFLSEGLGEAVGFDDFVAEAGAVGDEYLEAFLALFLVFVEELVVGVESGLALGLTGLGGHAHPFELALEGLAAL